MRHGQAHGLRNHRPATGHFRRCVAVQDSAAVGRCMARESYSKGVPSGARAAATELFVLIGIRGLHPVPSPWLPEAPIGALPTSIRGAAVAAIQGRGCPATPSGERLHGRRI